MRCVPNRRHIYPPLSYIFISMQAVQLTLMQALIKILTPTSPAYGNTVAFQKSQTSEQLQSLLQPGDVIFSRTNSSLYELARKYMGINYDHVAVVLNNKQVIHISPPIISKIDMPHILHPSRQPMVIRPKIDNIDRFMTLIHNFLGEKYNLAALPRIALNQLSCKMRKPNKISFSLNNLKYSRICSDAVLYALCKSHAKISESTELEINKTRYEQLGFFMPDEIASILLANDSELIMKSTFNQQHLIVNKFYQGSEKMINFARKIGEVGSKGMAVLTQKYKSPKPNKSDDQKNEDTIPPNSKNAKLEFMQLLSVLMALGQTLGLAVSTKIRFIMVALNMVLMIGQVKQIRDILQKNAKL